MSLAQQERHRAATLPQGSVVAVLLEQHARIRDLCAEVGSTTGRARRTAFDSLRGLLALHEAGEQIVVHPAATRAAGEQEVALRHREEQEMARALADLEKLDVEDAGFAERFAAFEQLVSDHARREESEEFPYILTRCDPAAQQEMGERLLSAQRAVHPYPAQLSPEPEAVESEAAQQSEAAESEAADPGAVRVGTEPFASLFDRARARFSQDSDSLDTGS
jgi:Hemerythrin HHE cation binding domain